VTSTPVDGVEIKCTLSGSSMQPAMSSFDLGDPDRKRKIWFFDSIDPVRNHPRLLRAGIILRLRRKDDDPGESTVKLRPAQAELLVGDFRAGTECFGKSYSVEYDWAHDPVLAASMNADVDREAADRMVHLIEPIEDRYSDDQLRLLNEAGTPPPDPFAALRAAGPIASERWNDVGEGLLAELRAERWTYGNNKQFLELSLQATDLTDAKRHRDALLEDLARRGLQPDPAGRPKTEIVLLELLGPKPHRAISRPAPVSEESATNGGS
jgi:hypothetical protein